ncbi:TLDc domain-containing protein [Entamoeba marina]
MATNNDPFFFLEKSIASIMDSYQKIETEVTIDEPKEIKELLQKYDIIYKDDSEEEKDLILKYETLMNELDNMKDEKYDIGQLQKNDEIQQIQPTSDEQLPQQIPQSKIKSPKKKNKKPNPSYEQNTIDKEMNIINHNSLSVLKQWSNKTQYNVIFDSKKDGNGWTNNVLFDKVFKKKNLYFISFNDFGDAYGGYVSAPITKFNENICDENAFIFSLMRKNVTKNTKYGINKKMINFAFKLYKKDRNGALYRFYNDICACKVNEKTSSCSYDECCYNHQSDHVVDNSLVDKSRKFFSITRIIVIEMKD